MNAKRQMPKQVALYVRTSTANGKTTRNQERELQAVAKRHGWDVAGVYRDQGISGAKGRDKRPGLDRLMQAVARREVDMLAAWSVDRLGRSLTDLLGCYRNSTRRASICTCISGARHVHTIRLRDVSDAWRVCRV